MSVSMAWRHTTDDLPFTDGQLDTIRSDLEAQAGDWCDRYGYRAVQRTWSVDSETDEVVTADGICVRPILVSATVVLTATLVQRTDGEWPSVRAALEEDGLLPLWDFPGIHVIGDVG